MTTREFESLAPTLFVGPFSAPEFGNNGTTAGLGHAVLAKFRNYRNFGTAPPVDKPTLSLARTATGLTLTFTGALQVADSVTGPWTDVAGASPSQVQFSAGARKFYRAKK
jgi:hypothetical protein